MSMLGEPCSNPLKKQLFWTYAPYQSHHVVCWGAPHNALLYLSLL